MKKVIRTPDYPIVTTKQGKLHGYQQDEVFHFYGIPYGTAERFMLPRPMDDWEGVRDAKSYGCVCPLMPEPPKAKDDPMASPESSFEMPHVDWPQDEDCLFLNVWTKHIDQGAKKPVMVWLHGGGFSTGSSVEIPAYNGHNLSDYGDVVVVNLNHRLNCLGFLDLSSFGEKYKYSGCVGMADIVLALQWIQDNIAFFGGDKDNVTVAGQSGGGGKAAILMQMPSADGLYHKVISQSGAIGMSAPRTIEEEKRFWQQLGEATVEELGLNKETIDDICTISYEALSQAAVRAGERLGRPGGMMLFRPAYVEGFYMGSADIAGFREETKDIPVMAGTVLGEFSFMHYLGDKTKYTEEEKKALLFKNFGEKTNEVMGQFADIYPELDPLYALSVDTMFRLGTLQFLNQRVASSHASCYNYLMSFIIPYLGGVTPWHCGDIPFVFRNVEMEPAHCTGYRYTEELQDRISEAWIAFMKTGNPSTDKLPWDAYTKEHKCRMMFAENCRMEEKEDQRLLESIIFSHESS